MKKKIKIGFKEYEIVKQPEVVDGMHGECFGLISLDEEVIKISTKYNQNQQNATFLHEIVHAIFEKLDMHEAKNDEMLVNQLATELYVMIKENPHIFTMKNI